MKRLAYSRVSVTITLCLATVLPSQSRARQQTRAVPEAAAKGGPNESALAVQSEVVRELAERVKVEQARFDQLNHALDQIENGIQPGSGMSAGARAGSAPPSNVPDDRNLNDRLASLANEIQASDERLAALREQARNPAAANADSYAQALTADAQEQIAAEGQLSKIADAIQLKKAQLALDVPVLDQLIADNIQSNTLVAQETKVAQEQAELSALEEQYNTLRLSATTAQLERQNKLQNEQRNNALVDLHEIEVATNNELAQNQKLQAQYAELQKSMADREKALNQGDEQFRAARLKLDRMIAELTRQRQLLARIEQS